MGVFLNYGVSKLRQNISRHALALKLVIYWMHAPDIDTSSAFVAMYDVWYDSNNPCENLITTGTLNMATTVCHGHI